MRFPFTPPPPERRAPALTAALLVLSASVPAALAQPDPPERPATTARTTLLGRSVEGRPIRATRLGDPSAPRKALVVGVIHGSETAGLAVLRELRRRGAPPGVELWLVDSVNPDGQRGRRRTNAHGVDLNRNFDFRWRRQGAGTVFYGGPRPFSEPESRVVRDLTRRIRPAVSIWYHQALGYVVLQNRGDSPVERRYARIARFPARRLDRSRRNLPGIATGWQRAAVPGSASFVVELRGGALSATAARRHARAVAAVARSGAG